MASVQTNARFLQNSSSVGKAASEPPFSFFSLSFYPAFRLLKAREMSLTLNAFGPVREFYLRFTHADFFTAVTVRKINAIKGAICC